VELIGGEVEVEGSRASLRQGAGMLGMVETGGMGSEAGGMGTVSVDAQRRPDAASRSTSATVSRSCHVRAEKSIAKDLRLTAHLAPRRAVRDRRKTSVNRHTMPACTRLCWVGRVEVACPD
jgi:hypothetical protein